jgi:maltose/maltodextrin transport system permease protein
MAVPILMVVFVLAFIGTIVEYPVAPCCCYAKKASNLTLVPKYSFIGAALM